MNYSPLLGLGAIVGRAVGTVDELLGIPVERVAYISVRYALAVLQTRLI